MVSSISVPPRSLAPPCSIGLGAVVAELHPRGLDVVDPAVQQDPGHRVHRAVVAHRRARAGDAGQVDRRVVVHERQRHELGEAAGLVLQPRPACAGARPSARGVSTWPYIIVERRRDARPGARCVTISIQVAVGSLPLVSTQRTSSSRISAAVPGIESSPASFASIRKSRERQPGAGGAVDDLHRAERVHVHVRDARFFTARARSKYAVPGQVGVDAALHADLGRAERPTPPRRGRRPGRATACRRRRRCAAGRTRRTGSRCSRRW